jgi:hypothetical protein
MPSSVIRDFRYDAETQQLFITFVSGNEYVYDRVPPHVYEELLLAESKGECFNQVIRDQYPYALVERA